MLFLFELIVYKEFVIYLILLIHEYRMRYYNLSEN
jgi:hypothetical protein